MQMALSRFNNLERALALGFDDSIVPSPIPAGHLRPARRETALWALPDTYSAASSNDTRDPVTSPIYPDINVNKTSVPTARKGTSREINLDTSQPATPLSSSDPVDDVQASVQALEAVGSSEVVNSAGPDSELAELNLADARYLTLTGGPPPSGGIRSPPSSTQPQAEQIINERG